MKYNMVVGVGQSGKGVSAASGGAFNPRKVVSGFDLKDAFRIGRSAIDVIASTAGIPLAQLRQMYRNQGVDPDKVNQVLTTRWTYDFESGNWIQMSDDEINSSIWESETVSRGVPANWILVGVVAVIFLLGMRR